MITPPGMYPEDLAPEHPLPPMITVCQEESPGGCIRVWAWAVGTDGSRCTREASLDVSVVRAYPELVSATARRVAEGVAFELQSAGLWDPTPVSF